MIERMLEGIEVHLDTDYLKEKSTFDSVADKVIYTRPIDAYFAYSLGTLEYRCVRFEHEILDVDNYQGNAVVNYTDRETPYTRIIEHKWFEFGRDAQGNSLPHTIISRGYSREWNAAMTPTIPSTTRRILRSTSAIRRRPTRRRTCFFAGGWQNTATSIWTLS